MTKDDIIRMAREAGVRDDGHRFEFNEFRYLARFAALVVAHERKAGMTAIEEPAYDVLSGDCVDAIRAKNGGINHSRI